MRRAAVAIAMLAGCGGDGDGGAPTWYGDVAPILAEHCMGCHRSGGIAPFSLESYERAAPVAGELVAAVEAGIMPPWDAASSDECAPRHGWKNDPRLAPAELAVLRDWIAAGKPAGAPAAIPPPPGIDLDGVTHTATPRTPYVTTGSADEFICYLLDPGIRVDSWMTGLQVQPGNPAVVHHATMVVFPPGPVFEAAGGGMPIGEPFACSSSIPFIEGTYLMGVWTPGSQPFETPPDLGLPVPARSRVLVQLHYHPGGAATNLPDASTLRLRLQSEPPRYTYAIASFGNASAAPSLLPGPDDTGDVPEFRIPPGATDHVETMRFPLTTLPAGRFPVFAAYPHMHYIGVELSATVDRPQPDGTLDRECLVNVPRWNFDWQRTYQYDATWGDLPTISNGDTLTIRCSYDNSLANPFVRRMLAEEGLLEPIEVRLGEESLDEMCLGIFGLVMQPAPE